MPKLIILSPILFLCVTLLPSVLAGPVSDNYELKSYGFGAGGVQEASSSTYLSHSIIGEQSAESLTGNEYNARPGLIFTEQANVPPAPVFINPGSTYDRLKLTVNTGNNPADAEFAIAITTDNWTTTRYIQNDLTIGSTLETEDFLTYDGWGAANGQYLTGLAADTTYTVKVKARQGDFTESDWGPASSTATSVPALTFAVSGDAIMFNTLNSVNSWTDSTKTTSLTTSTNAYNGYTVFAYETAPLTSQNNDTINDYPSPNSAPTIWTDIGFGYSTDDGILAGGTADRFTNGGPKYAGFTQSAPGDPVADSYGPIVEAPISNEQFNISYKITGNQNTPAGSYQSTVIYIVVPTY